MSTLTLLLLSLAAPSDVDPDPAGLMPEGLSVFVELDEPSRTLDALRKTRAFAPFSERLPADALGLLDLVVDARVEVAALGLDHSFLRRRTSFVLLLRGVDRKAISKKARALLPRSSARVFEIGPYVGIGDSDDTVEDVRSVAGGGEKSLLDRKDFAAFRRREKAGQGRFHVNIDALIPFRPRPDRPEDAGGALLAGHIVALAPGVSEVWGSLDLRRGLDFELEATSGPLSRDQRYGAPQGPALDSLAPDGGALRLSLRRDVGAFWREIEHILPEKARPGLAEFRNTASLFLGGLAVEELFDGIGTTFDVFVDRLPLSGPQPRHRYPTAALVVELRNRELGPEITLGFQEAIGAVNLQRSQEGLPRLLIATQEQSGAEIHYARFLPDLLPEKDDDRLQVKPALAIVGSRLILGSHPALVRRLVRAAAEATTVPRPPGDALRVRGPESVALLEDARELLIGRLALDGAKSVAEVAATYDLVVEMIRQSRSLDFDLVVSDESVRLGLRLLAPQLMEPALASKEK